MTKLISTNLYLGTQQQCLEDTLTELMNTAGVEQFEVTYSTYHFQGEDRFEVTNTEATYEDGDDMFRDLEGTIGTLVNRLALTSLPGDVELNDLCVTAKLEDEKVVFTYENLASDY